MYRPTRTHVAALSLSAAALVSIAVNESYRGEAYFATGHEKAQGISTIGYGQTSGVKPGDKTTPDRALVDLLKTTDQFQTKIKSCLGDVALFQREFDAYNSLAYNIGTGAFCASTLVRKLKSGDYPGACKEILRWDKQNGVVLRGLTIRRQAEYKTCTGE